jgi:hypothetical protein
VIVPIALLLLGYLVVGPHVLPGLAKYFIPPSSASAEEPAPTEQAAESKNK